MLQVLGTRLLNVIINQQRALFPSFLPTTRFINFNLDIYSRAFSPYIFLYIRIHIYSTRNSKEG